MRLLVECTHCQRQYDATIRGIGTQLRCHCGEVITVRQPQGHEARVVRCSSCGAARGEDLPRCPYCQSDFTLHERDLNTVCPHCLARVSDRAKFCHHCGTGLVPELDADAETDLVCPACQDGQCLVSRQLGTEKVAILECGKCAGFWLGHDAFRLLLERAKREALPAGTFLETPREVAARFGLPAGSVTPEARSGSYYRPCPVCSGFMNRRNYAGNSGVIIDLCREDGVWFDAEELARILVWVRAGGTERQKRESKRADPELPIEQPRTFLGAVLDFLYGPRGGRW
ncbi:MAG: zf-TFIIB domain-containing protein [Planctomycetia bacterium]|nr:zf-TFIIB domain-containing protein [Planctomycetia bacterium]